MDMVAHKGTTIVGLMKMYMERGQCIVKSFDKWTFFFVELLSEYTVYRHSAGISADMNRFQRQHSDCQALVQSALLIRCSKM